MYERRNKTMTFKEIAKLLETNIQTIPNLIAILKKGFEEAEAGSDVEVTQVQSSGTKIASIAVGEESTDIYAPSAAHNYSTTEQIVGKWIDGTTNVYEKTFIKDSDIIQDSDFKNTFDVTDLNINKIIEISGSYYRSGEDLDLQYSFGGSCRPENNTGTYVAGRYNGINKQLQVASTYTDVIAIYITMKYIKNAPTE